MAEFDCKAVAERACLTAQIRIASVPHAGLEDYIDLPGNEEDLLSAMSVLQGIVNEYQDGGDQMTEGCTCGKHTGSPLERTIIIELPYQLTRAELHIEEGTRGSDLREELSRMMELEDHEMSRVWKSAVILEAWGAGTLAECIHTAIIWERG